MNLVTMREAATLVGVNVEAVRMWKRRGLLKPRARDNRTGTLYYDPADVLRAESVSRSNDPTRRRARQIALEASRDP